MPRVFFSVRRLLSAPLVPCLLLAALLCGLACADAASARMTLLVPSQPGIEAPARIREEQKKTAAQQNTVQAAAKIGRGTRLNSSH